MAGIVDWDAIEDRGRVSRIPAHFENLQEFAMAVQIPIGSTGGKIKITTSRSG